jgi:hypothetical protein
LTRSDAVPEAAPAAARRRPLRRAGIGTLAVVFVLGILVGALAWQATRGSVSLEFVRERIETAIAGRLPADALVSIGSASFAYRSGDGLILRARDVGLALPGLGKIFVAELSTRTTPAALLSRTVELTSVTASGVEIEAAVPSRPRNNAPLAEIARQAAAAFAAQVRTADGVLRRAGLEQVMIREAGLRILDRAGAAGPALRISEAKWVPLDAGRSRAELRVADEAGAGWRMTVEGLSDADGVGVAITDLPVSALAPNLADAAGGPHVETALTLEARIETDADGAFARFGGRLSAGEGLVSFTGNDRIELAGAILAFELGTTGDRLTIPSGEVRTGAGEMRFEGAADLSEAGGATLVGGVTGGMLPGAAGAEPTRVTGGGLVAWLDFDELGLQIEQLHVTTEDGSLSAIGQASLGGPTPGLSFALSLSEMPMSIARAFWPPFVASKTRQWFDMNVKSGTVGPATLRVALPPDFIGPRGRGRVIPDYALLGRLPFREAAFSPLSSLPTITGSAGEIAFANATATLTADSGAIAIRGRGELRAAGTSLVIPELGRPNLRGTLHLELSGPAAALAVLSDTPPLAVAAKRGIVADALSGEAELSLDGQIPLYPAPLDELKPTFRLALTDFTSTEPISDRMIADADLVLEGSPDSFTLKGAGLLDGLQASVDLLLGSAAPDHTAVELTLDEAARERLGFDLGGLVTGPVQVSLQKTEAGAQKVALDLGEARISLPFLGWEKGAGVAATGSFMMETSEDGTRVSDLILSGKGFSARGALRIDAEGALQELQLSEVALRPGDSLAVHAAPDGDGYEVRVSGAALDARGILRGLRAGLGGKSLAPAPIGLSIDLGTVIGQGDVALSGVSGSLSLADGLQAASLTGRTGPNRSFEWTLGREGGARTLRLFADDGGALLRFAGIYDKAAGGNLILDYSGAAGGAGQGMAILRDFRVVDEGALAPAVRSARRNVRDTAFGGIEETTSDDLTFTQLRIPFRQQDWVIAIEDATLRGPMLGATASGTINVPGQRVAISGTFIPAFGLNNIAGAIPLIGTILGGGRDEGLVGITYKLFGPLDAPDLTMNPISAIAPGIFRKIFEYN